MHTESSLTRRLFGATGVLLALTLAACGGDDGGGDGGTGRDTSVTPPGDGGSDTSTPPGDSGTGRDTGRPPGDTGTGGCVPTIEICGDRMDQDCDGHDTGCGDNDGDRFDACTVADQMAGDLSRCDCDDAHANAYPGHPEECDGIDNNCDGRVDEAAACCAGCAGMGQRGDMCAVDGSCVCSTAPGMALCAAGQACCSSGCADLNTDQNNCGFCGTACTMSSDTCSAGECHCGTGPVCDFVYVCTGGTCGM